MEELSFGADCVIKLEDLGEFKDYSQTIQNLGPSLQALKDGQRETIPNELWEIIESDPQDTFFLPDFQNVLSIIASITWTSLVTQQQNQKILAFYFRVVEQTFISFTFGEDVVDILFAQIFESTKNGVKMQKLILRLLFNLSDKVMYIEEFNKLAMLWNNFNEEQLFKCYEAKHCDVIAAVYAQCCQKYLRNRQLRQFITAHQSRPFLQAKLALWRRNHTEFLENISQLSLKNFYNSAFMRQSCDVLQRSIKQ